MANYDYNNTSHSMWNYGVIINLLALSKTRACVNYARLSSRHIHGCSKHKQLWRTYKFLHLAFFRPWAVASGFWLQLLSPLSYKRTKKACREKFHPLDNFFLSEFTLLQETVFLAVDLKDNRTLRSNQQRPRFQIDLILL